MRRVAVIGRPNVGKSTLFNQLTGTRAALVKDEPGVTRDVKIGVVEWLGRVVEIFDTAGITESDHKIWNPSIRRNAVEAARLADRVIFVVDGKYGLNPEDETLARLLKTINKPVLLVVNKLDRLEAFEQGTLEFFGLGFFPPVPVSCEHKLGLDVVLDWMTEGLEPQLREQTDHRIRLAIVGKPNAGKSTLVNTILGYERVVASPQAGTTVDSIEVPFERGGQEYCLIDTAGLRRGARRNTGVEKISASLVKKTIERSDILVVVIDGLVGPSVQDARIVEMALDHHKPVVIAVNKCDVAAKRGQAFRKIMRERISQVFHFFRDIPVTFISAKKNQGIGDLFEEIKGVWGKLNFQVSTRDINDFFFEVIRMAPSPHFHGRDVKFYYITQTKQRPPSFMTFVNEPRAIDNAYRRFVVAQIKKKFKLTGIPVRIYAKKRQFESHPSDV